MKASELWEMAPKCARDRYDAMKAEHKRMCKGRAREPEEARALRKQMQIYYHFQCEAVRTRVGAVKQGVG